MNTRFFHCGPQTAGCPRVRPRAGFFIWLLAIVLLLGLLWVQKAAGQADPILARLMERHRQSPGDPETAHEIANHYYALEDYGNAETWLQKALEIKPDHLPSLFKMGNIYFRLQMWDFAEAYFLEVARHNDKLSGPHINLGTLHEARGNYAKAIESYARAARVAPQSPDPCFGLGDVYFQLEEWEKAVIAYEQGLKLAPPVPTSAEERRDRQITEKNLETARAVIANKGAIPADSIYENLLAPRRKTRAVSTSGALAREITLRQINFATNQSNYDSLDRESRLQLEELAKAVKKAAEDGVSEFIVEGHTDLRGSAEYNKTISERRARTIRDYLVRQGVAANRVSSRGWGEERPLSTEDNDAAHNLNRRVVVKRIGRARNLQIQVLHAGADGEAKALGSGEKLPRGDRYRVEFTPPPGEFVYVLRKNDDNPAECVYPENIEGASVAHSVEDGGAVSLPTRESWFQSEPDARSIVFQFHTAETPIADLEKILRDETPAATVKVRGILPIAYANRPGPTGTPELADATAPDSSPAPDPATVADAGRAPRSERVVQPSVLSALPEPVGVLAIQFE
jgi:outer membrane protein OmpA-like peptidoglycan-associated protein